MNALQKVDTVHIHPRSQPVGIKRKAIIYHLPFTFPGEINLYKNLVSMGCLQIHLVDVGIFHFTNETVSGARVNERSDQQLQL